MPFEDYKRRFKIKTKVAGIDFSGPTSNYTVYIDQGQADAIFFSNVQSDGGDIRITDINDNQLAADLIYIDAGSNKLNLSFKVPTLSALGDQEFYVYYDNDAIKTFPAPSDTFGSHNGYDANFLNICHTTAKVGAGLPDATSNGTDWIEQGGGGIVYDQPGKYGRATLFPSTDNDYFDQTSIFDPGITDQEITISCWINSTTINSNRSILSIVGTNGEVLYMNNSNGKVATRVNGSNYQANTNNNASTWYRFSGRYKNTSPFDINLILNGILDNTPVPQKASGSSTNNWNFGRNRNGNDSMYGLLGELSVSNTLRSDEWLKTEFDNQDNTVNLWTAFASELVPMASSQGGKSISRGVDRGILRGVA